MPKKKINTDPLDTPVMRQYQTLKQKYPHAILFFRMGDFYELFLEDAQKAAPLMEVALTNRQGQIPMAGIPYHSAELYVSRLLEKGYHVAIAEQETDPHNPHLMCRRVRRVITPGTVVEEKLLNSLSHNYLMAMVHNHECYGVALADISTGDFFTFELKKYSSREDLARPNGYIKKSELLQVFRDQYAKFSPREVLVPVELYNELRSSPEQKNSLTLIAIEDWKASPLEGRHQIEKHYKQSLKGLGYEKERSISLGAASLILHYVQQNFPDEDFALQAPLFRSMTEHFMQFDEHSIRNLEIIQNQNERGNERTLYSILDLCQTSAGKRFLRESLLLPLLDLKRIHKRQRIVNHFVQQRALSGTIQEELKGISDIERILSRIGAGRGAPRDLLAVTLTIQKALRLSALFQKCKLNNEDNHEENWSSNLIVVPEELSSLAMRIQREVHPEAPALLPGSTPFLQSGLDERLDKARQAAQEGSNWIINFEKEERQRIGVNSLRVKYNKIHGYFIEISRQQAKQVPSDYYRRQTLVGYERFSNQKLTELETILNESESIIQKIEQERFKDLCQAVLAKGKEIKKLMRQLARLDFFLSLANVAFKKGWVMPKIHTESKIEIKAGRHPVVEHYLPVGEKFSPNDLSLDSQSRALAILTGPNMAGKSTYIRQIALIQLLAQIGSFVPAESASLGVRDRIFTRIGAGDNLTRGESTFFVEMLETARILNQSTRQSLVIMDEVGRGTSTYDGLSLAWAIVEHLTNPRGARPLTLFATHYHELTALDQNPGIFNLTMEVHEQDGEVLFLHRVRSGVADRSYGIHVAHLAGLPRSLIQRAQQKLEELEAKGTLAPEAQSALFASKPSPTAKISQRGEQNLLF